MQRTESSRFLIPIVIFLDIIILGISIFFCVLRNTKNAYAEILIAPKDATIIIDNTEYKNGVYNFYPGTYTATIKKDNFETKEISVELKSNQTTLIYNYLTGINDDFSYYEYNQEDFSTLLRVAKNDEKAQKFLNDYNKYTKIRDYLPMSYAENGNMTGGKSISINISDGSGQCQEKSFCIIIKDYFGGNLEKALSLISERGYNPSDYEIYYTTKNEPELRRL